MVVYKMSETYRPLPDNLTIGKSKIEGVGLISVSDIESAVLLGITHVYFENDWIRTPLGGFINHSIDVCYSIACLDLKLLR